MIFIFSFFNKNNRIIKQYRNHLKSDKYNAEIFVRQKVKSLSDKDIVVIEKIDFLPNQLFAKIIFSVCKRKLLAKTKKPTDMDTSAWKELTNAKQYALDLDTVRAVKNKRTSIRQFVFKGEMKRKPEKQIPPVLIKGAPAELLPLGDKFKNGEHVNLSKILPYLNPDYLDFESEKYVVKYEEITKCLPRNQTQKRQKKKSLEKELQPKSKQEPQRPPRSTIKKKK